MKQPEPKTLIFDIETSLDILASYGLKEQYHSPSNILQDWYMICFCWKWLGGTKIYNSSVLDDMRAFKKRPDNDLVVVKRLHDLIGTAEVIVGHNMQGFDWKKFMARVIYHNLPPIDKPIIVDTLKEARKIAAFTSNKMSYLAKYLKISDKQQHAGDMWLRILKGDAAAVREAVKYCRGDIVTTEELYLRLRPYMSAHPNHNLWRGDGVLCCPRCNGTELNKDGFKITVVGKYQRYQCQRCGYKPTDKKSIKRSGLK